LDRESDAALCPLGRVSTLWTTRPEFQDLSLVASAIIVVMDFRRKTNLEQVEAEIEKIQEDLRRLDKQRYVLQRRLTMKLAVFKARYVKTAIDKARRQRQPKSSLTLRRVRDAAQRRWGLPPGLPTIKEIRDEHGCTWRDARLMQRRLAAEQKSVANPS
jgi:hypothetical protein